MVERVLPRTSFIYKLIYLGIVRIQAGKRNGRKEELCFQVGVVDSCNLNCIGCVNFSPLHKSQKLMDISSFEKDIKRIGELTNGVVKSIMLMGGEPLLHPKLTEFFEIARKYIRIGEIGITTNGILLLKQDANFWESCKTNRIKIEMTPYPIKLDYERIIEIAEKYSVVLEYVVVGSRSYFNKTPMNIEGNYNINKNFKKCFNSDCAALRDGKIYTCSRPSYISSFNEYFGQDFKVSEKDYIDIYAVSSKEEILDFMCKPLPFCRYCNVNGMDFGVKWEMSKKEIGEWI
jgi:MoaA/NifB/PqqE/SkfB family radical SAM enzyme